MPLPGGLEAPEPRCAAGGRALTEDANATRRGPVERAEDVEQRRLADAGRAHERDDLGRPHDEARAPEHAHDLGPRAVLLLQLLGDHEGLAHCIGVRDAGANRKWPDTGTLSSV